MRVRFVGPIIGLAVALAALLGARAQTDRIAAAKTNSGTVSFDPHDLTGIWNPAPFMQPKGEVNPLDLGGHPDPLPPFTAEGEAKYRANAKFIAAGAVLDCDPFGTARNFFTPRPFEILSTHDRLVQHFEYYDNWREIWTDGRKIPADVDPEYMGYSIGHWDGNTFVVDSAAYNGKAFLTWQGFPISSPCIRQNTGSASPRTLCKSYLPLTIPRIIPSHGRSQVSGSCEKTGRSMRIPAHFPPSRNTTSESITPIKLPGLNYGKPKKCGLQHAHSGKGQRLYSQQKTNRSLLES